MKHQKASKAAIDEVIRAVKGRWEGGMHGKIEVGWNCGADKKKNEDLEESKWEMETWAEWKVVSPSRGEGVEREGEDRERGLQWSKEYEGRDTYRGRRKPGSQQIEKWVHEEKRRDEWWSPVRNEWVEEERLSEERDEKRKKDEEIEEGSDHTNPSSSDSTPSQHGHTTLHHSKEGRGCSWSTNNKLHLGLSRCRENDREWDA